MIQHANYTALPGFSKLFTDYFKENSLIYKRFPAIHQPQETFDKRISSFKNRENMMPIFFKTMEQLQLSPEQEQNARLLKNENTLVVITGQQVGLFGGALYTFFKAQSAIAHARKYAEKYPQFAFVPVFWVEDNDHDRTEAEQTAILNKDNSIVSLKAPGDLEHVPGVCIGEIRLTDPIVPILENLSAELAPSPYFEETIELLKTIYTPGKLWSDAYMELLHHFFKNTGLLFVKGSEVRKSGLSREILLKELSSPGGAKERVETAIDGLVKGGYHVQAEPSDIHLFFHDGKKRFKVNMAENNRNAFSINGKEIQSAELLKTARNTPELFSPNVLLRPIVQDFAFPTAAYIAGPGELAYAAELCEMYEYYGVEMPMFVPRHSATLLDISTEKFLKKAGKTPLDFMQTWQEVEEMFVSTISDEEINALFKKNASELEEFFKNISQHAVALDPTLFGAVEAAKTLSEKPFARLYKKITAAQKRREAELLKKYRSAWANVFPNRNLQERTYCIVHFWAKNGEDALKNALLKFNTTDAHSHFFINF
ncbi:MAG TPA: bacillithiol biosynthesis cysteine-adding enzyme BshC [Patescibacteria group bacterium]|nr:bacillithiol biosynthesis cysteine-adding enzyme BshC [Patescibacteria group bacterium]